MFLPAGMTEEEVLSTIEMVVQPLAGQFVFPGYDFDDLAQEARIFAMEALPRYNPAPDAEGRPTKPLENFLFSHVRNRLINFKRDHFRRTNSPCPACHNQVDHEPTPACKTYARWKRRNDGKALLLVPADPDKAIEPEVASFEEAVQAKELLKLIDEKLDLSLRPLYLAMRAGVRVHVDKRDLVLAAVREILGENLPAS